MNLTPKQRDLLIYLDGYIKEKGCAPSYDEMTDAMSLASKSGINRLVVALEERGFVRRLKHRARAIEVLRMPGEPARAIPPDVERDALKAFVREIAHDEPDRFAMRVKAQRLLERFP